MAKNSKYQGLNLKKPEIKLSLIFVIFLSVGCLFGGLKAMIDYGSISLLLVCIFVGLIFPLFFYLEYKSYIKIDVDIVIKKSIFRTKKINLKDINSILIIDLVGYRSLSMRIVALEDDVKGKWKNRRIILSTHEKLDPENMNKIKWKGTHILPYYPELYTELIKSKASI